jgi:hypothetical protein
MKKNLSTTDSFIRILTALIVAVLYFTHQISGWVALVLGIFSLVFIATGFLSFCPIYKLMGISTKKNSKK